MNKAIDRVKSEYGDNPFATILYRTPYLVLPKLAIIAMSDDWQMRFAAMLMEMKDAGIRTPNYLVFRDVTDGNPDSIRGIKQVNPHKGGERPFYRITGGHSDDPWADYRHGDAFNLSRECPND